MLFNMKSLVFLILLFCANAYASEKGKKLAHISYTLWIHNDMSEVHNVNVSAPVNMTFYEVMKIAASKHAQYVFKSTDYSFGHYINEIGGYHEDKQKDVYWMIYQTPKMPNRNHPPTDDLLTNGVDYIHIKDGDHYLFWYKNYSYQPNNFRKLK